MKSLWEATAKQGKSKSLNKNISTDVLIIGGGMAGLLCARLLTDAGADCVLLEQNALCGGVTKNTTAKITSQHGLIYDKLIAKSGTEKAKQYLDINEAALKNYRALCCNIDCDFEEKDNYVYSLDEVAKIRKEADALKALGTGAEFTKDLPLPFPVAGAVKLPNQAQFNPLKFACGITGGLKLFEHTRVRELKGLTAITDNAKVTAKRIIIATHFPILNKHGLYFLKLYQHRSYVIAVENAPFVNGMFVDEAKKGMSFRNYKNLLLIGGGDHRTGKNGGGWEELRTFKARNYPDAIEKYHWATQDCMSLDGIPYIGPYSKNTEGLFVATGFNKWGMTSSMAAAMLLCDMLNGKNNPSAELFSPSRSILQPQLILNGLETTASLLTPTAKRCPHLGCALKWNKREHTWDCPCHGSRFTADGKCIDNPATGDLKK